MVKLVDLETEALVDTVAVTLSKAQAEALGEKVLDAKALIDIVSDTLREAKAEKLGEKVLDV